MAILMGILAFFGAASILFFHQPPNATRRDVIEATIGKTLGVFLILTAVGFTFWLIWSVLGIGGFVQNITAVR